MTRERKRSGRWKGSAKKSGKKSREQKVRAKMEEDGGEKTGEFLLRSALLLSLPLPSSSSLLLFFFIRKEKVVCLHFTHSPALSLSLCLPPCFSTSAHSFFRFSFRLLCLMFIFIFLPLSLSLRFPSSSSSFSSSLSCLPSFSRYHSEERKTIHKAEDK